MSSELEEENDPAAKNLAFLRTRPMTITLLDLCAYFGLIAVGAVTINMLLGTLMVFRYSPKRSWPHHRFNYFRLHNWTGYVALFFATVHPLVLLLNRSPRFRVSDILFPIQSPQQPLENTLGAIALYVVAVLVVTSYMRVRLGRHIWKAFHYSIYIGAIALFWHSLFTDPNLSHSPVDWLDGGKIFVESCTAVIVVTSVLRYRHSRQKAVAVIKQASGERAASA